MRILIVLCVVISASASAKDLTVEQIIERTNQVAYYQGSDGRARVKMTISDERERTRTRAFVIIRKDDESEDGSANRSGGKQKMYILFKRPADVNKMAFLVWKQPAEDDARWLYLPALDLVKRIAASDKRTSFVGSHFFYEDVSGRSLAEDEHELVKTTDTYFVVRNRSKKPADVEFDHFDMWIHRTTFLPIRTEYFDARGERYRLYEALEVKTVDGYATVVRSRMSDFRTGGNTLLEYDSVAYDVGLPEEVFTERYLRSPPNQHLR
ncbi:MAG: outer membrane lipoprotein-sorting protein [bacterium]|nr:outer membrane lipoprotein-sorting protein [bacterium]